MTSRIDWLDEARYPFPGACFALPTGIYFLLKFRPDLGAFEYRSPRDRLALYLWWESVGKKDYPDFDWLPRPEDIAYIGTLDGITIVRNHSKSVTSWLRGMPGTPSILDHAGLYEHLLKPHYAAEAEVLRLPCFLHTVVSERPDLSAIFDLGTFLGRLACIQWWHEWGYREYPRISWNAGPEIAGIREPACHPDPGKLPCPRFLQCIIQERSDLKKNFNLDTFSGRLAAINWWQLHGHLEYKGIGPLRRVLTPDLVRPRSGAGCEALLPELLISLLESRPDLNTTYDITTVPGVLAYLAWWETVGQAEYPASIWNPLGEDSFLMARSETQQWAWSGVPHFLKVISEERCDLRLCNNIENGQGLERLVSWWHSCGRSEYPFFASVAVEIISMSGSPYGRTLVTRIENTEPFRKGVNIIGFPEGILGLGEDARAAAKALEFASVPTVLINAPMPGPEKLDLSCSYLIRSKPEYDVSIFCLPPPEMLRLAMEGGRYLLLKGAYKIGAWPWELPAWPQAFGGVYNLVDEIWAQSKFVQSVLSRQTDIPVYRMPMAVSVQIPVAPLRSSFGLPEGAFLFYMMFDGHSWLSRKNPLAGILAFRKAFAHTDIKVGLVIKAMNVSDQNEVWKNVLDIAASDERIYIISQKFTRSEALEFMATCDAYISLHRSEGFGRVIAEAMLLGKPVVVTKFSGNLDFCDEDTACLVDGNLIPLRPGDYIFHEGQYWCDPDIDLAAKALVRLVEDSPFRKRIAKAGQGRIASDYSIEAVAKAYSQRLNQIYHGRS